MKTRLLIIGLVCVILVLTISLVELNMSESKDTFCLILYMDINEISRTPEMSLAERYAIDQHRNWIFEYVEKDCPDFNGLELIYNTYKQNLLKVEQYDGMENEN